MIEFDKDKALVDLKKKMSEFFDEDFNREWYITENTYSLMAKAALNVLLTVEDYHKFLKREGDLK